MNKIISIFVVSLLIFFGSTGVAFAISFDLADDWNWNYLSDPDSVWSYNYGISVLGTKNNWINTGHRAFASSQYAMGHVPAFIKVESTHFLSHQSIDSAIVGDVVVHGTDGYSSTNPDIPANITWTSNAEGKASISGDAWIARNNGVSMSWNIYLNNSIITGGLLDPHESDDFTEGFGGGGVLSFNVFTDDVVKFEIVSASSSPGGNPFATYVGLDVTIDVSAIPEPATILLFGTGLAGLVGTRIRRKKK